MVSLWLPFASARVKQVYNHTLLLSPRLESDCQHNCPAMDIWLYQLKDPQTGKILSSKEPIATKKQYWKSKNEARIIAISLFGGKDLYYNGLLQYLDSFASIKKLNGITDKIWGYETFTVRVYVSRRNPKDLARLKEIGNAEPDYMVKTLLDRGCEVVFVDNKLERTKKDGTFWRFAITSEPMHAHERIRYLVRDADSIVTAIELYTVADWIMSDKRFHRMHIIPVCFGPLTASLWGGSHTGAGDFVDFYEMLKFYPYRFLYGDDEMFTRDLIWPRIKSIGSVLTHHFAREGFMNTFGNPYRNSCEEPTDEYCKQINPSSNCEDRILPETVTYEGANEALGLRVPLDELVKNHPEFFDLKLSSPERRFVYEAFRSK